jgi:hypothetical protein
MAVDKTGPYGGPYKRRKDHSLVNGEKMIGFGGTTDDHYYVIVPK